MLYTVQKILHFLITKVKQNRFFVALTLTGYLMSHRYSLKLSAIILKIIEFSMYKVELFFCFRVYLSCLFLLLHLHFLKYIFIIKYIFLNRAKFHSNIWSPNIKVLSFFKFSKRGYSYCACLFI